MPLQKIRKKIKNIPSQVEKPMWDINGEDYTTLLQSKAFDFNFSSVFDIDNPNGYNLSFEVSDNQYCCGLIDIGELYVDDGFLNSDITKLFDFLASENKKTIMITTIQSQEKIESALKKCKNFTLVKSFINPNTKNTISIWISHNH